MDLATKFLIASLILNIVLFLILRVICASAGGQIERLKNVIWRMEQAEEEDKKFRWQYHDETYQMLVRAVIFRRRRHLQSYLRCIISATKRPELIHEFESAFRSFRCEDKSSYYRHCRIIDFLKGEERNLRKSPIGTR